MILIYHIRRAKARDSQDIKDLHKLLFVGPVADMPSLTKGYWWVLKHDKRVIGFAHLTKSKWFQNTGYLSRVGIHPRFQGMGFHRRLIRVRERHSKALLWSWVVTDTAPDNYASSNSLVRRGYSLFKPWYPWAWNKHSLYWGKKLTG